MRFRKLQAVLSDWTVAKRAGDEVQAERLPGRVQNGGFQTVLNVSLKFVLHCGPV